MLLVFHQHINNELVAIFLFALRKCVPLAKMFVVLLVFYSLDPDPLDGLILMPGGLNERSVLSLMPAYVRRKE